MRSLEHQAIRWRRDDGAEVLDDVAVVDVRQHGHLVSPVRKGARVDARDLDGDLPAPIDATVGRAGGALGEPSAQLSVPVTNEASGSGGLSALSCRPDGKIFAAGGWDRRVRLWQWRKYKPIAVLKHHTATVHAVDFSPCSRLLATASADKTIGVWQLFAPG